MEEKNPATKISLLQVTEGAYTLRDQLTFVYLTSKKSNHEE